MTGGEHSPPTGLPEGQSHSESQNDVETQLAEVEEAGGQPVLWRARDDSLVEFLQALACTAKES